MRGRWTEGDKGVLNKALGRLASALDKIFIIFMLIVESLKEYWILLIEMIYMCLTMEPYSLILIERNERHSVPVAPSDMQFSYYNTTLVG